MHFLIKFLLTDPLLWVPFSGGAQIKGLLWEKWLPSQRKEKNQGYTCQAVGCLFLEEHVGDKGSRLLVNRSALQWQGTCGGKQVGTPVLSLI